MADFDINGIKLYYEYEPGKNGETVFFLNGVMMSASSWKVQADFFKALGYGVLLHDFKGQLLSDKPEGPYDFADHVKEGAALLDFLKLEKVHLVGTSYGGEVGLLFAIEAAARVKSLSVIDSVARVDDLLRQKVERWELAARHCSLMDFFNSMLPDVYGREYIERNKDTLSKKADIYALLPPEFLKGQIALYQSFYGFDVVKKLGKIKVPTLVVCGEEDYLKTVRHSREIYEGIANAEFVVLPGAGHACFLEKADAVNTLLLGFIAKHP